MRKYLQFAVLAGLVAGLASLPAFAVRGQNASGQGAQQPSGSPAASTGQGSSQAKAAPVKLNPKEEKAYKAFYDIPTGQPKDVVSSGQDFLKKFPTSRYAGSVYGRLAVAYETLGDPDQMMDAGQKALQLNPDDVDVLSLLAYSIPRRINPDNIDSGEKLQEATQYAMRALELLPKVQKPAAMPQDQFTSAINAEAASCHSGLGLIAYYQHDPTAMVTQLEQAVKLNPTPDPSDQYLLGIAYIESGRAADAEDILQKCVAEPGPLAAGCKRSLEQAQKLAASQQKK
ncbi:MAG TPA: hypothetical protein VNJ12_00800 [Candidatus Dormibacteraeota bacterium]|nr:hypothetical protein [Candidatus Dormibacteraeota bacterium]